MIRTSAFPRTRSFTIKGLLESLQAVLPSADPDPLVVSLIRCDDTSSHNSVVKIAITADLALLLCQSLGWPSMWTTKLVDRKDNYCV